MDGFSAQDYAVADGSQVCVSSSMIQEVKRIIKDSEILKYAIRGGISRATANRATQGGRFKMAAEEQGWTARTGDPAWE